MRYDPETETLIPTFGGGFDVAPVGFSATDYESGAFERTDSAGPLTTSADRTRAAPIVAFSAKDHGGDAMEDCSPTLRAGGHADSHANAGVMPVIAFQTRGSNLHIGDISGTLGTNGQDASGGAPMALSVSLRGRDGGATAELGDECGAALRASGGGGDKAHVLASMQVRRLTPRETERLQGFADDYTLIPYGRPTKAKLDMDFIKYQLRGNPKHLTREDVDRLAKDGPRYKSHGNSWAINCVSWIGQRIETVEAVMCEKRGA
jgi:DNA (cytosine-5)-methyltransferase 1